MPERSEGDLSAETMICLPASTRALNVWKNSSCVLSLPIRNCRSSIISTSTPRSSPLNSMVDWLRIAAMKRYMNFSADMYLTEIGRAVAADQFQADRVHQMGLAQADAAVEEERIEAGLDGRSATRRAQA